MDVAVGKSERKRLAVRSLSLALAVWGQWLVGGHEFVLDGVLLYTVALILWARSLGSPLPPSCSAAVALASPWAGARRWGLHRPAIFTAGIAIAANLAALWIFSSALNPSIAWLLYATSVAAAPFAVWLAAGRPRPCLRGVAAGESMALALALAVGAFFRLYRIDSQPFGLWWDEAYSGLQVLRIMNDPTYRPVYVAGMAQEPSLFWYLLVPFFRLLGASPLALRFGAVVGGLLGLLGVYLLARELLGRRVGMAAVFLLAAMTWDVNFSRIAFNCIWSVALDALAAFLFLRGMRTGSPIAFGVGGVALGLGLNMYYTSRLVPGVLVIYLIGHLGAEGRQFFRRHLGGLLLFSAVTLITVSPLLQFAYLHPLEFFSRTEQTNIFREISESRSYAPLVENVRKHLLMFLYEGDRNGRHNIPGAPMLDPITGALFALGLLMAVRGARQGPYLFLLSWTVIMLGGGVFSLAFEAPQGLRTIDEVTSVAILAALPLASLWRELEVLRPGEMSIIVRPRVWSSGIIQIPLAAAPVLALLLAVALANFDRYFIRQANHFGVWSAFSAAETIIGNRIKELGTGSRIYLGETFVGHPTVEFIGGRKDLSAFLPAEQLPLAGTTDVAIFLEPDRTQALALLRGLYPQAEVQQYRFSGREETVLHSVVIPASQVLALQGLIAHYYTSLDGGGDPAFSERLLSPSSAWQTSSLLKMPFLVIWQGTLVAPDYGTYGFRLQGPSTAELLVDGFRMRSATGDGQEVVLARGNHALRVRAVVSDPTPMQLLWRPPKSGRFELIPRERLFTSPASNHGLLGAYYPNRNWEGSPAFQRVDPFLDMRVHLLPLPRPYSVEWRGKIDAPRSGLYRFATESADASWVYLDDQLVVTNDGAPRQGREGSIRLEAGLHDLRVRFRDETSYTFIRVYWTPPDGDRELLPTDRLYPPQGGYPPSLRLPAAQAPSAQVGASARLDSGSVQVEYAGSIGAGSLGDPRDVAASPDGRVLVVETAAKRVVILNPDGSPAGQLAGDFAQPFGVAASSNGKVTVLDSLGRDPVLQFGPGGEPIARFGQSAGCYSPRGLYIDPAGSMYLADTGRGRILKLDASGNVVAQFRGGGRLAQPVSVAVDQDGALYVADGERQELLVIATDDTVRRSWPIPPSTTFDAAHVALGPRGEVYVSDPNGGTIIIYDAQGKVLGHVGTKGSGEGQLSLPTGVRVDAQGRLWVADTGNKRVQVWALR